MKRSITAHFHIPFYLRMEPDLIPIAEYLKHKDIAEDLKNDVAYKPSEDNVPDSWYQNWPEANKIRARFLNKWAHQLNRNEPKKPFSISTETGLIKPEKARDWEWSFRPFWGYHYAKRDHMDHIGKGGSIDEYLNRFSIAPNYVVNTAVGHLFGRLKNPASLIQTLKDKVKTSHFLDEGKQIVQIDKLKAHCWALDWASAVIEVSMKIEFDDVKVLLHTNSRNNVIRELMVELTDERFDPSYIQSLGAELIATFFGSLGKNAIRTRESNIKKERVFRAKVFKETQYWASEGRRFINDGVFLVARESHNDQTYNKSLRETLDKITGFETLGLANSPIINDGTKFLEELSNIYFGYRTQAMIFRADPNESDKFIRRLIQNRILALWRIATYYYCGLSQINNRLAREETELAMLSQRLRFGDDDGEELLEERFHLAQAKQLRKQAYLHSAALFKSSNSSIESLIYRKCWNAYGAEETAKDVMSQLDVLRRYNSELLELSHLKKQNRLNDNLAIFNLTVVGFTLATILVGILQINFKEGFDNESIFWKIGIILTVIVFGGILIYFSVGARALKVVLRQYRRPNDEDR